MQHKLCNPSNITCDLPVKLVLPVKFFPPQTTILQIKNGKWSTQNKGKEKAPEIKKARTKSITENHLLEEKHGKKSPKKQISVKFIQSLYFKSQFNSTLKLQLLNNMFVL